MFDQWGDCQVHAFQSAGRPHDVAVIERKHHSLSTDRAEDPRKAVLHSPFEVCGSLEEVTLILLWNADAIVFRLLISVEFRHVFGLSF
jgi:hypothetical protein